MTTINSTLMVHAGGIRRTRAGLAEVDTPPATDTWRPVPHFELAERLVSSLGDRGIAVLRDEYCTHGPRGERLFGVLDLAVSGLDTADYRMALGLRASNDRSMAIQAIAAARVFVCDNMAFSGSSGSVMLRRKHTSGLDLGRELPPAVETFLERSGAFRLDLDRMRDHALTDGRAKEVILDAFAGDAPVLPVRLFKLVVDLYFRDDLQREKFPDRSLWSLDNTFTEAVKVLKAAPQAEAALRIGRYFGRLIRRPNPRPIAVIDGVEVFPAETN